MSAELKDLIQKQGDAFAEFKKVSDERFAALAKGQGAGELEKKINDIVADYDAKKDKMDALYEEMQLAKSNGITGDVNKTDKEYQAAFLDYVRKGKTAALDELQKTRMNAMSVSSDPDGGYFVSPTLSKRIIEAVGVANPMRQLATIENISTDALDIIEDAGTAGGDWVAETGSRSNTDTPTVHKGQIAVHEMYANPKATQKLLDDASVDIEAFLARKVARKFDALENSAFISGSGVGQPKGLLAQTMIADASFAWGKLGYVKTASASALSGTAAELMDAIAALDDSYLPNAAWLMTASTLNQYRKARGGSSGANVFLLWNPSLIPGQPDTLLGFPVRKCSAMDEVGSNKYPVAFGDFRQGYTIVDRVGIRTLRDPFTSKPYVQFYTTRRVGGDVVNFEAIKIVKCEA